MRIKTRIKGVTDEGRQAGGAPRALDEGSQSGVTLTSILSLGEGEEVNGGVNPHAFQAQGRERIPPYRRMWHTEGVTACPEEVRRED